MPHGKWVSLAEYGFEAIGGDVRAHVEVARYPGGFWKA
jgi:hypothetical protein